MLRPTQRFEKSLDLITGDKNFLSQSVTKNPTYKPYGLHVGCYLSSLGFPIFFQIRDIRFSVSGELTSGTNNVTDGQRIFFL